MPKTPAALGPRPVSLQGASSPMPNVVETQPSIEEYDLPDAAAESELAVAESLLAALLARSWLAQQQDCLDAQHGSGPQDEHDL